ncbi:MAG: hypothetical protein WDN72_05135 [Alphaproteobacteria bacterium]
MMSGTNPSSTFSFLATRQTSCPLEHGALGAQQVAVDHRRRVARQAVLHAGDAGDLRRFMLGDEEDAVLPRSPQRARQVLVLAGHVGMQEKDVHQTVAMIASRAAMARLRCVL